MAQQTINVGTAPNDGTGTPLRTAFQYTNSNFSELYTAVGPSGNNIVVPGNATITGDLTVRTSQLKVDSVGVGVGTTDTTTGKLCVNTGDGTVCFRNFNLILGSGTGAGLDFLNAARSAVVDGGMRATNLTLNSFGANPLILLTNSTERYRIASDGIATWSNVGGVAGTAMTLNSTGLGIGLAPVGGVKLSVAGTIYANAGNALILDNPSSNFVAQIKNTGSSLQSTLAFLTGSGTSMLIDNSGNVGIGVTPAGTGGCLQLKSGITFPATQVASSDANTLDDYEEGTFTPGITFGGASVGMTGTFAGRYVKIGRSVTVNGLAVLSAKGSSTGTALITGLPFTASNAAGSYWSASLRFSKISFTDVFQGYIAPNSASIILEQCTNAGNDSVITDSNFPVGLSVLIFSCTYDV